MVLKTGEYWTLLTSNADGVEYYNITNFIQKKGGVTLTFADYEKAVDAFEYYERLVKTLNEEG